MCEVSDKIDEKCVMMVRTEKTDREKKNVLEHTGFLTLTEEEANVQ